MANPVRGEVSLPLRGDRLVLRPSFSSLVAAEGEVGSLFGLLERAGRGDVRLAEIAALFWHCLDPQTGTRTSFEAELLAVGPSALLTPYRRLLGAVFGDG